jgi:hypothetical protein
MLGLHMVTDSINTVDVRYGFNKDENKMGWSWINTSGVKYFAPSANKLATFFDKTTVGKLSQQKRELGAAKSLASSFSFATNPSAQASGDVTGTNLFSGSGKKKQQQVSQALSASTTDGSKSATTKQNPNLAPTAPPPVVQTVSVGTSPVKPEAKEEEDDDDESSQLGTSVSDEDADANEPGQAAATQAAATQTPDRRKASIEIGVGKQALQQQNQPSPLAQENAAPTGFQGAAPAAPMRSASGPSNVIHKVAVQRISAAKGIPFETYRQAYMQSNGAEVESMSDNELYQSSVDLCDQGIDTVKIKKPRFTSGRANLIREFIELNVLYNMAKPKEAEQGSKLAMLLDASNMGISAEHMMQALKGSVGGADGHIKQNAAVNPTTLGSTGPPAGSAQADAAFTMGDSPNALNVKNTASYTSTTMHGKRIDREFIMDRLRFDNNFSSDTPVTETTFHFKKKAPESRKLIRF